MKVSFTMTLCSGCTALISPATQGQLPACRCSTPPPIIAAYISLHCDVNIHHSHNSDIRLIGLNSVAYSFDRCVSWIIRTVLACMDLHTHPGTVLPNITRFPISLPIPYYRPFTHTPGCRFTGPRHCFYSHLQMGVFYFFTDY